MVAETVIFNMQLPASICSTAIPNQFENWSFSSMYETISEGVFI
jgi:hypothetical protein